jgi:hypothetical protein
MRKIMGIVMGLLIIVTALYNSPYLDKQENTSGEPNLKFLPGPDFKKIGYYVNSSSEFVNAVYYLMKYNPVGPYIESFTSFEGLSNYSMVIIPHKSDWSLSDTLYLKDFIENGGLALVTTYIPNEILDVDIVNTESYYVHPETEYGYGNTFINSVYYNYDHFLKSKSYPFQYYPAETPRDMRYIGSINENVEIWHQASNDLNGVDYMGPITVSKTMGSGRLAFITTSVFDYWGQKAMGGPIISHTAAAGSGSGSRTTSLINFLISQLLVQHGIILPQRWHTPYAKLGALMSRDDVDSYSEDAVRIRGEVDYSHNIPTIFYELRDDIPASDWNQILYITENDTDGFHLSGYHRHTGYEYTAVSYLNRILDIEAESGLPTYFECHHGASSGFFGQDYVRTAVEATNNLTHPIVYTSSEGGHWNTYLEPFLYRTNDNEIIPAENYYAFPKDSTIDKTVINRKYDEFQGYIQRFLFNSNEHVHYLLHSQNVQTRMESNYDELLNRTIDPIYTYLYTDPVDFVNKNLNHVDNISTTAKINSNSVQVNIDAKNNVSGYSFMLPFDLETKINNISIDGNYLDLSKLHYQFEGNSQYLLFYLNLTQGNHDLIIDFESGTQEYPDDLDQDFIQDRYEVAILETNPNLQDSDIDLIIDGMELFRYETKATQSDSDTDELSDYDEIFIHSTDPNNPDTDYDLMPDGWEVKYGLDVLRDDASEDLDGDGLTNYIEYTLGFLPNSNDSDNDGISDYDEVNYPTDTDPDTDPLTSYTPETSNTTDTSDTSTGSSRSSEGVPIISSTPSSILTAETRFPVVFSLLILSSIVFIRRKNK